MQKNELFKFFMTLIILLIINQWKLMKIPFFKGNKFLPNINKNKQKKKFYPLLFQWLYIIISAGVNHLVRFIIILTDFEQLKAYDAQISEVLKHVELQSQTVGGKLSGMSFCFTGEMSQPRSFFQGLVTKHGGKNDSGVTKTTTYLVCNENKGSSKSKKAEQYGSKTINEQAFMSLVGEIVIQSKPKIKTNSLFEE